MSGHTIAEVASLTGIPATALRYYEQTGVTPAAARGENGYRRYGERDIQRLQFLGRARQLDLTPEDLRVLTQAWDTDSYASVQQDMQRVLVARLSEARERIAELASLSADPQRVVARLSAPPKDGPCDDTCVCDGTSGDAGNMVSAAIPLTMAGSPEIACTLSGEATVGRVEEWAALLTKVMTRQQIEGGWALSFPADPETAAELARLAVAEQECCSFFGFRITFAGSTLEFEVEAPPAGSQVVTTLFGGQEGTP